MKSRAKHGSLGWRNGATLLVSAALTACQLPGSSASAPSATVPPAAGAGHADSVRAAGTATLIQGRVVFPAGYVGQATTAEIARTATLTLVDLSTNRTVVVDKTDDAGNFALDLDGYSPGGNGLYLLEASKGLGNNAAGLEGVRIRTFLKWTGSAWTSISGTSIVLNTLTTALTLISNLDGVVTPGSLIGTVSGTALTSNPNSAWYSNSDITGMAAAIATYLTNDLDPVESVSRFAPNVTGIQPGHAPVNNAIAITGSGFSPIPGDNVVLFGGSATGSVYMATSKQLIVNVPSGASTGNVTVTTRGKVSNAQHFTVDASAGGGSGPGGFYLSEITPNNGVPGDYINIMGAGFSQTAGNNTVTFQKTGGGTISVNPSTADGNGLSLQIPANAVSGLVSVTVGGNTTNRFYFNVNVPTILSFNPTSGGPNTEVTVNGANFGAQGLQSGVKFNGNTNQSSVISWGANQSVVKVPGPSLTAHVTGPISVSTAAGGLSQPYGTFTASTNVAENFSTTNYKNAATNAAWTGSGITPNAQYTAFSDSGVQFADCTITGGYQFLVDGSGVSLKPFALRHTGVLPYTTSNNWNLQLGVDDTYYSIGNSSAAPNYTYNLATGAYYTQYTVSGWAEHRIWSPGATYAYTMGGAHSTTVKGVASWASGVSNNFSVAGSNYSIATAYNGTYLLCWPYSGNTAYLYGSGANSTSWGGYVSQLSNTGAVNDAGTTAAGLAGSNTFYYNKTAGQISTLGTITTGNVAGTVTLPISVDPMSNGAAPSLGSDQKRLYLLGRNAGYHAGADTLFRFAVSGSTITMDDNGTCLSPVINLPANHIWDVVNWNGAAPAGSTLKVDVMNSAGTTVLISNVSTSNSLNSLPAGTTAIRLRATFTTTTGKPNLSSWSVVTRPAYVESNGYDSGTNSPVYKAPTIAQNNASYTIEYNDSADGTNWSGTWVTNITTLSRRFVRYRVKFSAVNTVITSITLPYEY